MDCFWLLILLVIMLKLLIRKFHIRQVFFFKFIGKKNWEVFWKDINLIKSLPTSQGSKVFYFITNENENFLVPQRLENFEEFLIIISKETGLNVDGLSYISPLWTYKLLTLISLFMIIGEVFAFSI